MACAFSAIVALLGAFVLLAEGPRGGLQENQPDLQMQDVSSHTHEDVVRPFPPCKVRGGECGEVGRCGEKPPALYKQAPDCNRREHQQDCCIWMH